MEVQNASQYMKQFFERVPAVSVYDAIREIPAELGTFQIQRQETRSGVALLDWHVDIAQDMEVCRRENQKENSIQMVFFLNQGMCWEREQEGRSIFVDSGEVCVYQEQERKAWACYPKGADYHFVNLQISKTAFEGMLQNYFDETEQRKVRTSLEHVTKTEITPEMYQALGRVEKLGRDWGIKSGPGKMRLEAGLAELMALYLERILEKDRLSESGRCVTRISPSDRAGILEVRKLLEQCPYQDITVPQLARQVHISETKLTKGFSSLYGISVHAYQIEKRLEYAASLLVDGEVNVSQAAGLAGYSNMSHFSAAFKKKFGELPKEYKRRHFSEILGIRKDFQ